MSSSGVAVRRRAAWDGDEGLFGGSRASSSASKPDARGQALHVAHWCVTLMLAGACVYLWLGAQPVEPVSQALTALPDTIQPTTRDQMTPPATGKWAQRKAAVDNMLQSLPPAQAPPEEVPQAWYAAMARLQNALTLSAAQAVVWRWGIGPHRVRMWLQFPASMSPITIEMAPVSLQPVSNLWFLSKVESGFWTEAMFMRNADHVLQAAESPGRRDAWPQMPFQEYDEAFPHEKWTLGTAGRPGGPSFYVSIANNVANHGPGGQQYTVGSEADVCFARVVEGFPVLERLHKLPVKSGSFMGLQKNVPIRRMEIVLPETDV